VKVENHPVHIVFTENGKYALVANNEDNNVSVIDMASYSVIQTIPTGKGPHGFRISKDSKYAYIANMGEDSVSVLNLETMKEEKKMKVGSTPVTTGITSDGKTLVVTLNAENSLTIVDLASGKVNKVPVGQGPAQVYMDSDDKFAYVANQETKDALSHSVSKINIKAKKVVAAIETGKGAHGVVTNPDHKYVFVTNMCLKTRLVSLPKNKIK
jgi:YVTN family beta-propeller protein